MAEPFELRFIRIRELRHCSSPKHLKAGGQIISGLALDGCVQIGHKCAASDILQPGLMHPYGRREYVIPKAPVLLKWIARRPGGIEPALQEGMAGQEPL